MSKPISDFMQPLYHHGFNRLPAKKMRVSPERFGINSNCVSLTNSIVVVKFQLGYIMINKCVSFTHSKLQFRCV